MKQLLLSVAILATTLLTANAATQRTTTLDFTATSITYAGGATSGNPTTSDITDSSEGWAWYINGYTPAGGTLITGKVLVLNGIDLQTSTNPKALSLPANVSIVLTSGSNNVIKSTFSSTGSNYSYGIISGGALTITGAGSLTVTAGNHSGADVASKSYGISATDLTIDSNITLNAKGGNSTNSAGYDPDCSSYSCGINATALTINSGGTLTATAGNSESKYSKAYSYGIDAANFTIGNGVTLSATAGNSSVSNGGAGYPAYSYGINATTLTIGSGGTLTATAGTSTHSSPLATPHSFGVNAGTISISGGSLTAQGNTKALVVKTAPTSISVKGSDTVGTATDDLFWTNAGYTKTSGGTDYAKYAIAEASSGTGFNNANVDSPIIHTEYYDINGKKLNNKPAKGFYIENNIHENGARTGRTMGAF